LLAANTPNINAEPILDPVLIFSTFVDLQLGHFIAVTIGRPQPGQLSAKEEISLLQSGQDTRAIRIYFLSGLSTEIKLRRLIPTFYFSPEKANKNGVVSEMCRRWK
jgi:hypothetical protein